MHALRRNQTMPSATASAILPHYRALLTINAYVIMLSPYHVLPPPVGFAASASASVFADAHFAAAALVCARAAR